MRAKEPENIPETSQDILFRLDDALNIFGVYQYDQRGPKALLDLNSIVRTINDLPIKAAVDVLEAVCLTTYKQNRNKILVAAILEEMQDLPPARWDFFMENATLQATFDGEF